MIPEEHRTVSVKVIDREGKVIIQTDGGNYLFDPGSAVAFANSILAAATNCGAEIEVMAKPKPISDEQRMRLITRCSHVLRSLQGKKEELIAYQIVDTILSDIK